MLVPGRVSPTMDGDNLIVFFWHGHYPKMKPHKSLRSESDFSGQNKRV